MKPRDLALLPALLALIAGCGLKGSLTLPEKPGEVAVRPGPGAPAKPAEPTAPPAKPDAEAETESQSESDNPTGTSRE
jgi:hypothetical protein